MGQPARALRGAGEIGITNPVARSALLSLVLVGALASQAHAQPPPVTPNDFVAAAGGADQYEVLAGRIALVESRDAMVRAFAEQMVREHTDAAAALRDAALKSGLKPPSGVVGGDQAPLLAALQGLRRPDFDRAYARQQVLAHRQALATERGYTRDGADPNLRGVAMGDVPMIERHLQAAEALEASQGH